MVAGYANAILQYGHMGPDPAPVIGDNWALRFLERHPEYFIKKQQTIDTNRKNAHKPNNILAWFKKYHAVCQEHNIQPADQYNFDETGFRIGIGRDQGIITCDPNRQGYLASSTNRELVSVCETISADGTILPPMITFLEAIHQEAWYMATSIPDNYLIATSESGYNNDDLTIKWLEHFEQFSGERQVGAYRLLLLDGFGSHCTKQFIDYCDCHNIIVFCLPPHSSHLLQPLDVVVFQPYKHYHAEAVEAATRMGCGDFNKCEFLDQIHSIRQQTFKSTTVRSAFQANSLIPYNPGIVISKLREAVAPATIPLTQFSSTPEGIPLTIASLRTQGNELLNEAQDMTPEFQHRLKLVLQGGLALAQSGVLAIEHMENTRAAEQLRSARRRAQSRRQVQKGGVLDASEAHQMVKRRVDTEVEQKKKELRKAENEQRRENRAKIQPFLDGIKARGKARHKAQVYKGKVSRLIVAGIRQQARLQKLI